MMIVSVAFAEYEEVFTAILFRHDAGERAAVDFPALALPATDDDPIVIAVAIAATLIGAIHDRSTEVHANFAFGFATNALFMAGMEAAFKLDIVLPFQATLHSRVVIVRKRRDPKTHHCNHK